MRHLWAIWLCSGPLGFFCWIMSKNLLLSPSKNSAGATVLHWLTPLLTIRRPIASRRECTGLWRPSWLLSAKVTPWDGPSCSECARRWWTSPGGLGPVSRGWRVRRAPKRRRSSKCKPAARGSPVMLTPASQPRSQVCCRLQSRSWRPTCILRLP